jgi:hypothetical protein
LGCGEGGEGVAGGVEVGVGEVEVGEAVEEPGGAGGFAEGWGGDAEDFELPFEELGLVEVQPLEGAVDCGVGGEAGYAEVRCHARSEVRGSRFEG